MREIEAGTHARRSKAQGARHAHTSDIASPVAGAFRIPQHLQVTR
jgi:hypothetical protein